MRRLIYIMMMLGLFLLEGKSQQAPVYSQYMLNGFLMNPAVAGSEGYSALNLTVREQWVGLEGGPSTYALSFQGRIMEDSKIFRRRSVKKRRKSASRGGNVGLGGYLFNHSNGAVNRTGLKLTYAYHIEFDKTQLSLGLSLVGYQYRLDDSKIELELPGDNLWQGAHKAVFIPDADVGIYLSAKEYWVGLSVDQLLESAIKFGDAGYDQFVMERNYYLMGGYDFILSEDVVLSPSAHIKFAENGKMQADISGKCYFMQNFWGGLTYRTGQSLVFGAGVSVDRLVFGYAYDMGLSNLQKHSFGTHEFTFIAKLGDMTSRYRWLSRF